MWSYRSDARKLDRLPGKQRLIEHVQNCWQLYRFLPHCGLGNDLLGHDGNGRHAVGHSGNDLRHRGLHGSTHQVLEIHGQPRTKAGNEATACSLPNHFANVAISPTDIELPFHIGIPKPVQTYDVIV